MANNDYHCGDWYPLAMPPRVLFTQLATPFKVTG